MKDLYKRTGINPTASAEVIEQFLANQTDSEDRAATRHILQVEHRRRVYDRVRETYVTLGAVGANLHMSPEIPADFRQPPSAFGAQIQRLLKRYCRKSPRRNNRVFPLLILFGVVAIVVVFSQLQKSTSPVPTASNPPARTLVPTPTPFDEPQKSLPNSGTFWTFTSQPRIAPFKITTQSGSRYYIKLVDASSKATAITIFMNGAQTIHVDVPLGTFEVRWASGWIWYGPKYLFGPKTQCTKGMDLLTFARDGDYVSGHDVTLYKVPNGNFETTDVDVSEF